MAIFQTTKDSGYRGPAKSMTLKALESRMKAAQEASATASQMQTPISDPMQGWGYLANILGAQAGEARAESASIHTRDELAKIKAGIDWSKGPSSEQYAQLSRIDPEGADKIMQDWVDYRQEMEKQTKQNEFTTGERTGRQEFEAGQSDLTRQHDISQQDDQQKAASDLAVQNQTLDTNEAKRQEAVEAGKPQTGVGKIEQDFKNGLYGDPNTPEAQKLRDDAIAKENTLTSGFAGPAGANALTKMEQEGNVRTTNLQTIDRATDLINSGQVVTGPVWQKLMELGSNISPEAAAAMSGTTVAQVKATQEFQRIAGLNAMTQMSGTLSGSDSDRDVKNFMNLLANPASTPDQIREGLARMRLSQERERNTYDTQLITYRGKGLSPYEKMPFTPYTDDTGNAAGDQVSPGVKVTRRPSG